MKKTLRALCLTLALCASLLLCAAADSTAAVGSCPVTVNGSDTGIQGCLMVPLRAVAEEMGFTVTWKDGAVWVDNGAVHTIVTPGVDRYTITTSNPDLVGMSAPFSLGMPPYVCQGVTYVPVGLFDALAGREDAVTIEDGQVNIQTDAAQIPNPFSDCASLKELSETAGFSCSFPQSISGYDAPDFRAIPGDLAEAVYSRTDDTLCIRKGAGTEDISGDYQSYEENSSASVNGLSVTFRGSQGKIHLALWTNNGYAYSIRSDMGLRNADMTALVKAVG